MRKRATWLLLVLMLSGAGCSLPPERPVYRDQLYKTRIFQQFTIKESPESVLAALNRDGEAVVEAQVKDQHYYIRILATREGLKIKVFDK